MQPVQDLTIDDVISKTQYQFIVEAANPADLTEWVPKLVDKLGTLPQLNDVASDMSAQGLSAYIDIDRDTAGRFGITPATIDNALYDAFGQRIVSTIFTNTNQYRVILQADPKLQQSLELAVLDLPADLDRQRPGAAVGDRPRARDDGPAAGQPPRPVPRQYDLVQPQRRTLRWARPSRRSDRRRRTSACRASVITSFQGAALAFQSALSNELFLILAAIVTVYIVLGVLYESFIHPVTILSTLPSAGIGALLALMLAGDDLTIIAIIGIILLIGIVKKNAIMMIDFALDEQRNHGRPPREAIYQACLLRFRPILMTTMAAVLGALPLMVGTGVGSELRHPLGISIVGGLLLSQVLTLFTTPVIYLWFDRLATRLTGASGTAPAPGPQGVLP